MSFDHTDQDGARLFIQPADTPRYGRQVHVHAPAEGGVYVDPSAAGEAAAAILESAGVDAGQHDPDLGLSPEEHESVALAYLRAARQVRAHQAELAKEHAAADAFRQRFPEIDPYADVPWEDMTEKGKQLHLGRRRTALEALRAEGEL